MTSVFSGRLETLEVKAKVSEQIGRVVRTRRRRAAVVVDLDDDVAHHVLRRWDAVVELDAILDELRSPTYDKTTLLIACTSSITAAHPKTTLAFYRRP